MKFAHISDIHIGVWRDQKLRDLSTNAFIKAVDVCMSEKIDFLLISGDLFNTAIPSIESLKQAVIKLRELRDKEIPVYIIAGSHDFSPSGKTMIDVLEEAELVKNVCKGNIENNLLKLSFTVDPKTGANITGMIGKKGMLERKFYENLERESLEKKEGFKIFLFHSGISELKPKGMENVPMDPLSFLPKGFDYYAGGHIHYIFNDEIKDYGRICFPGALFPCNFKELEEFKHGGFCIYEDRKVAWVPIKIIDVVTRTIDCHNKTIESVHDDVFEMIKKEDLKDKIITLRFIGKIHNAKATDIDMRSIMQKCFEKGAYYVMKNTNKLSGLEFDEIKVKQGSIEEIEREMIEEHTDQSNIPDSGKLAIMLMNALNIEKDEGERAMDFESKIKDEITRLLDLTEDFND